MNPPGRLIILSGPSCAGKSPLDKALGRLFPELHKNLIKLVLYNDRAPRPGELDGIDYHFRPRGFIEGLKRNPHYLVLDVRGDLQALDLNELRGILGQGNAFFEGNPFVSQALLAHPDVGDFKRLSVFLSPFSREEILYLKAPERQVNLSDFVTDVMRRKLLRRTQKQRGELSPCDLEDIEKRAVSAYRELRDAWRFDYVIPNHDGEDSDHWDAFSFPLGDARKALFAFAELLQGRIPVIVEKWGEDTLSVIS